MSQSCEAEFLAKHQAELAVRDERLAALEKENELLRRKIDLLVRKLFDASGEKLDPAQLLLLLQGMDEPPGKAPEPVAAEAPPRRRRGIGRLVGGRAVLDGPIASA
jgi:hypothetical protein